jgi:hypothetical protein
MENYKDFKTEWIRLENLYTRGSLDERQETILYTYRDLANLILPKVNRSLPTKEQLEFYKLGMKQGLKAKGYYNKIDIKNFMLGFENCLYFIEQEPSDNG